MTLATQQRAASALLVGAGLASVLVAGVLPAPFAVVVTLALLATWPLGERVAGRAPRLWTAGLGLGGLWLAWDTFARGGDLVLGATQFTMLLALYYANFAPRTARNENIRHVLALLLLAAGAALSAELSYAVAFAVFAVAGTWALALTHLRREVEDDAARQGAADPFESPAVRRLATPRFLGALAGLATAALVVAALIFFVFPRASLNLWQRRGPGGSRTGFSAQLSLEGHGLIKDNPRVALRVRPVGRRGSPDPSLELYWRGASFNVYDGKAWQDRLGGRVAWVSDSVRALDPATREPVVALRLGDLRGAQGRDVEAFDVEISPDPEDSTVFTTGRAQALLFERRRAGFRLLEAPRLLRDGAGDLSYVPPQPFEVRYRVWSRPEADRPRGDRPPDDEALRSDYLSLPGLDPRIVELGQRLAANRDPPAIAAAIERHLEGYRYSLAQEAGESPDPLASFLFEAKAGHCEYFATALAVLLRVGGVPTRLVTGYYGGRYIRNGGYYAVREGDAHAWVEAWFSDSGWTLLDATPPDARPAALSGLYEGLRLWLDGVSMAWRSAIVDYDIATQARGVRSIVQTVRGARERLSGGPRLPPLTGVAKLVGALAGAALLAFALLRLARRPGARTARAPLTESQRLAAALWRDLARQLERRGLERRPAQTPRELVAEAGRRGLVRADAADRVLARCLEARFGTALLDADEARRLRRELRSL